jgi:hypothetical protein
LTCRFNDIQQADSTLVDSIVESCQLGIFKWSNGNFFPKKFLTAEESTAVLIRILFWFSPEESNLKYNLRRFDNYTTKAAALGLIPAEGFTIGKPIARWVIGKMIYLTRSGDVLDIVSQIPNLWSEKIECANRFSFNFDGIRYFNSTLWGGCIETENYVSVIVLSDMPGYSMQRVLQYNKATWKMIILDTAGKFVKNINDTHMIYFMGYCYEGCTSLEYRVTNLANWKTITLPGSVPDVSYLQNIKFSADWKNVLFDETIINWTQVSPRQTCASGEGLWVMCKDWILYEEILAPTITSKSLPLP